MISILIVDDNQHKISNIRKYLETYPEISVLETATNIVSAKRILMDNHFDLLILDLGLPLRDGNDPLPENGIKFLQEINMSERLLRPSHILGFTAYDEYIEKFKETYDEELWALIKYEFNTDSWKTKLSNKIKYLIRSKHDVYNKSSLSYQYDVAIITALRNPELESILKLDIEWTPFNLNNDSTEYFKGILKNGNNTINLIAASAPQMGMVAASSLTSKIIHNFRPKYIVMTGIAAGVGDNKNLGDILVADLAFDSGSGKINNGNDKERVFLPDFKTIDIDTDIREKFISLKANRKYLDEIRKAWPTKIPHELNIHIGPFASGAAVIANKSIIDEIISHNRKLIGLDMEAYGVYYSCKNSSKPRPKSFFSLKSISDFADNHKNDNYQEYASYTSASLLFHLIKNELDFSI